MADHATVLLTSTNDRPVLINWNNVQFAEERTKTDGTTNVVDFSYTSISFVAGGHSSLVVRERIEQIHRKLAW